MALKVAKDRLPTYTHQCSPHKFTQPQLFVCLVLKRHLKLDYRGIVAVLADWPTLCDDIGLASVPHYTTLQKASARLLAQPTAKRLLDRTNQQLEVKKKCKKKRCLKTLKTVKLAAADSTGMEARHGSRYFTKRRKQTGTPVIYRRFPKLSALVDTQSHMILSMLTEQGPKVDVQSLCPLLDACVPSVRLLHLLADAGYDSEENHRYLQEEHGIITTIPPRAGRPTHKRPKVDIGD